MLLKKGSKGDDVAKVQAKLNLTADGDFGAKTEAAVIEWQTKNGLKADGIIGDATWDKMFPKPKLNVEALRGVIPNGIINQIPTLEKFNVNTNLRLAHFLAQACTESGNFGITVENLNYSIQRLIAVFPKYFNEKNAPSYAKNPQKIANLVYANRMGNGPESSGDGWKYRGRGYIQLTGKDNYTKLSKVFDVDFVTSPDLVATTYPLASAAWFFDTNNLWAICDMGSTDEIVTKVSKKVNGGTNGLSERLAYFKKIYKLIG